jgi:serine/threonine protein kinase
VHRDVKTGNVLLQYIESSEGAGLGQTILAKVSDFGTVRVNTEQEQSDMRTNEPTHASTRQVCGTGPYMPPEYEKRGHVSERTDSFAFGIVIIELLTGLHPVIVREIVDESLFEELPALVQQYHDGKSPVLAVSAAAVKSPHVAPKCRWPIGPLKQLAWWQQNAHEKRRGCVRLLPTFLPSSRLSAID